jgi:membrane protease YdiL (CAAX protease family)
MTTQKNSVEIGLFLAMAILLSAVFWTLIIQAGHIAAGGGHYVEGLMWCPAIAALLVIAFKRLDIGTLGLSSFGGRYALLGYVTPLVYALIAYALVWGLGLGSFPNPAAIAKLSARLGWHVGSATLFVPLYFLLTATTGMIGGTARALGEEIGWRGFMAPRMVAQWGFTKGAVVAGAIWAAWHMPLLLFADYNSGTPWWFALSCFAVFVIASSVMLTWIRLRSQSVWPCAILHASHNLFIQAFFTPLTAPRGGVTAYAIDEFGVAAPAVALVIAFLFWRARGQVESSDRKVFS